MSSEPVTVIIGGGIAGLAAAWALTKRDQQRVLLLEGERLPFTHSSGRNAAIFRPLEHDAALTELATRSYHLLCAQELWRQTASVDTGALLDRRGLVLATSDEAAFRRLSSLAVECGVEHQLLRSVSELTGSVPLLQSGCCRFGVHLPQGGVLDVHAIGEALRRAALRAGATLRTGVQVASITRETSRVSGVELAGGEVIQSERVVIAAGAWGEALGASCGCSLPLVPHRRHLALLEIDVSLASAPVVWNIDNDVYFRKEGDGALACPGDHQAHVPGVPSVDPKVLERLAKLLPKTAPKLAGATVRRAWAGLRTMTPDSNPVIGPDPRLRGLFWFGGLGGFGMTTGLAAARLLASGVFGETDPLAAHFAPERLLERRSAVASPASQSRLPTG